MLRYFLGRELADRLGVPLARWKRWAREFLPPDPLGGLQSGYARHYSIDEAFTVYLAGRLVSRSKFTIPEARTILSDLESWLNAAGYRAASSAVADEKKLSDPAGEHMILISAPPAEKGQPSAMRYTIRGILSHRQLTGPGRPIVEERYETVLLGEGAADSSQPEVTELKMICITRILLGFVRRLELNADLFIALRHRSAAG